MIHTCDEAKLRFYINEMTVPIHISNIDLNTQKHLMQLNLFLCVITVHARAKHENKAVGLPVQSIQEQLRVELLLGMVLGCFWMPPRCCIPAIS